jgi:hypothetical protein
MKATPQSAIIAAMAVVIAVLAWALVYFARDELALQTEAPEEEISVQSAVGEAEGFAAVKVSAESQEASGIAVQALESAHSEASAEIYGVVVNVQPLMDLRARYVEAVANLRALRAAAANSTSEYQRLRKLFDDDRNVSERAVQAAQAQWNADQARLAAAEQATRAAHDSIRASWGEVLANLATDPESPAFEALAQQREALMQVTFPYDLQGQAGKAQLAVAPMLAAGDARPARYVSPAPQTDATLPGVTYFYATNARGLRTGMRVATRLKLGGPSREGVVVPAAAVVWHGGKAWAYVKESPDLFVRKEVSTAEEQHGGWFDAGHFEADDEVVVSGAQLLLSEELKFQIRNENED